jgi:hypothetical protein
MKFFEVSQDMGRRIPGRWTLGYLRDKAGHTLPLSYGIPFGGNKVDGKVFAGSEPTDFSEAGNSVPVVRAKLAKAIVAAVDNDVQCIPLVLEGFPGFVVLNALRVVDCIDLKKSGFERLSDEDIAEKRSRGVPVEYRYGDGDEDGTDVYIDGSRVPDDAHIFRTKGFETNLIVSERLKEVMERNGCIGARFTLAGERSERRSKTSLDSPRKPASKSPPSKASSNPALPKKSSSKTRAR